nr:MULTISPECIES: SH3 domain-containing protein [unclassified Clostridium]
MNRAGRIIAVCGLSVALMMPQAAYAAETLSVQVSAREGITTVGNKQSAYDNVAISHVSNYVNIRSEANTSSSIVGKIYNNCAATILATVDGEGGTWYQIQSGSVKGYIKSEYFITGAEAEKIAKNVGTVYVTVSADGLNLREQPNMNSAVLTTLSKDSEYLEVKEDGDFIEIQVDESLSGYVHKDYVTQR